MPCTWGIIGPGFIATRAIIPALQQTPDAHVLAVASRDAARARATAAQFGIERFYGDYQDLLNDPDIDVVYIALPNSLHCIWTMRAAQAGKHVLCEKPLAITSEECASMIATCQKHNVLLMEAVMYRFHPRMRVLHQMVTSEDTGTIRNIHASFSFPFAASDNYRASATYGGGALLDIGSYCINAVRWLTGSEPHAVQSVISCSHNLYGRDTIDVDMTTSAMLEFDGDVFAHIFCSFTAAEHQVIEVVGSTGAITIPLAFTAWKNDRTMLHVQRGEDVQQFMFEPADPYALMVAHFTDCVMNKTPLLYSASDGQKTLAVLEMIRLPRL